MIFFTVMQIKTQEELFKGPVKIKYLTEKGIKVSKILSGEKIKVMFDGEITRKKDIIEIKGKIFVDKVVECIRCLDEFYANASDVINIYLKPSYLIPDEEEIELKIEDLDDDFYEGEEMDFYSYIISLGESIVPSYNLCSENCRGICKNCGENLNKNKCRCHLERASEPKTMDLFFQKQKN